MLFSACGRCGGTYRDGYHACPLAEHERDMVDTPYVRQPFNYQASRDVQADEHPRDVIRRLIDDYEGTMALLPPVVRWRREREFDVQRDFASDRLIAKITARGWLAQRSDGSTMLLP